MSRINKIDFFSGAFLSYLISNGVKEPTLFEATEKSKIIKFSLRNKDYNVYLKYVSTSKQSIQKGKNYVYLQEYGIARDGSNRFFHQSTEAGHIYFTLF